MMSFVHLTLSYHHPSYVQLKFQCSTFVRMGCITSKVITKSMSFHKEMSQSLPRTTDGIPVVEDRYNSSNGSDHIFDFYFLC